MRSMKIFTLLIIAVLLVACQSPSADTGTTAQPDAAAQSAADVVEEQQDDQSASVEAAAEASESSDEAVTGEEKSEPVIAACTVENRKVMPTPDAVDAVDIPAVDAQEWIAGGTSPLVTIIDYCDFESTDCAKFDSVLSELQALYPNDLQVVYRHYPLPDHEKGILAAQAVEAAALQDREMFYTMKELIYETQDEWLPQTVEKFETWLQQKSGTLGLDIMQFSEDLSSEQIVNQIVEAQTNAAKVDVEATPVVIINGSVYRGPRDLINLNSIIRLQRMEERSFSDCPEIVIDEEKEYQATIKTSNGDIIVELYPEDAPLAVNSFVYLAQNGWYDREYFHNVVDGVVAQAGDPSGTGFGGPGFYTTAENSDAHLFDQPGMVAMYQVKPQQNGSQFFITFKPMAEMNGQYTIIGKVTSGMELVEGLQPFTPAQDGEVPQENIIVSVTIEEK